MLNIEVDVSLEQNVNAVAVRVSAVQCHTNTETVFKVIATRIHFGEF